MDCFHIQNQDGRKRNDNPLQDCGGVCIRSSLVYSYYPFMFHRGGRRGSVWLMNSLTSAKQSCDHTTSSLKITTYCRHLAYHSMRPSMSRDRLLRITHTPSGCGITSSNSINFGMVILSPPARGAGLFHLLKKRLCW